MKGRVTKSRSQLTSSPALAVSLSCTSLHTNNTHQNTRHISSKTANFNTRPKTSYPSRLESLLDRLDKSEIAPVMIRKQGKNTTLDCSFQGKSKYRNVNSAGVMAHKQRLDKFATKIGESKMQPSSPTRQMFFHTMLACRRKVRPFAGSHKVNKTVDNDAVEDVKQDVVPKIERFRAAAKKVLLLVHVFNQIRRYAMEKGNYSHLTAGVALQLKDAINESDVEKDLLFNPTNFQCRYQAQMPPWAKEITQKSPGKRSSSQIQRIARLMNQLKCFRKYTKKMQYLLAKVARFESFGRRRVVIRKGHIGTSFYIIFAGKVAVVLDGDEDMAFMKNEKPPHTMTRGEAFGELALVRRTQRSATVVCLEKTEFLVIDKTDFFEAGIDQCVTEEMSVRVEFLRSLPLFDTWDSVTLRKMAEEARIREYFSEKVIVKDSTDSEYIYFILKGQCDILRLLDLSKFTWRGSRAINTAKLDKDQRRSTCNPDKVTSDNDVESMKNSIIRKRPIHNGEQVIHTWTITKSNQGCNQRGPNCRRNEAQMSINAATLKHQKYVNNVMPIVKSEVDVNSVEALGPTDKTSLGVLIKVDTLLHKQCFGLSSVLDADKSKSGRQRRFIMLSSGCEVITVPQKIFKKLVDEATMEKVRRNVTFYPSDEDLYSAYVTQSGWRAYREQLVDEIVTRRPRNTLSHNTNEFDEFTPSRPLKTDARWKRLVENGLTSALREKKGKYLPQPQMKSYISSAGGQHVKRDTSTEDDVRNSKRTLVLTHGGYRFNAAQRAINMPLGKRKCAVG